MTSTETASETPRAAGLTKRLLELRPLLGLLLFVLYVVIRGAYSRFYAPFGLSPDDLGLSYLDLLAQSAIATLALPLLALVLVSSVTLLPFAGIELGNMSPPKTVLALISVAELVLLTVSTARRHAGSSRLAPRPCSLSPSTASADVSRAAGSCSASRRGSGGARRSRS